MSQILFWLWELKKTNRFVPCSLMVHNAEDSSTRPYGESSDLSRNHLNSTETKYFHNFPKLVSRPQTSQNSWIHLYYYIIYIIILALYLAKKMLSFSNHSIRKSHQVDQIRVSFEQIHLRSYGNNNFLKDSFPFFSFYNSEGFRRIRISENNLLFNGNYWTAISND